MKTGVDLMKWRQLAGVICDPEMPLQFKGQKKTGGGMKVMLLKKR